jgi:hypothetical protein
MNEPSRIMAQSALADPVDVFRVRCGCYAQLYRLDEYDLPEAVDYLQEQATVLIEEIGQDAVQLMMADAFRPVRTKLESRGEFRHVEKRTSTVETKARPIPHPTKILLRQFWIAASAARHASEHAELQKQFMEHARASALVAAVYALSRHGEEDVRHVLTWALAGRDPWGDEFNG